MRICGYLALLMCLASATEARSRTILVYAGVPYDGANDISANWMMAKYLKRFYPHDRVVFAIDEDARPARLSRAESVMNAVKAVVPGYMPYLSSHSEGVDLISVRSERVPLADYALGFSIQSREDIPKWLVERSRMTLIFEPLSTQSKRQELLHITQNPLVPRSLVVKSRGAFAMLQTGPLMRGLYSAPLPLTVPMSRELALKELNRQSQSHRQQWVRALTQWSLNLNPMRSQLMGFAQASSKDAAQYYIDVIKTFALSPAYESKQITIAVQAFEGLQVDELPVNLKIVTYKNLSRQLREALIAHSDLPVQVSDPIALSQAIHFQKMFWGDPTGSESDVGILLAVLTKMDQANSYFSKPEFDRFFRMRSMVRSCLLTSRQKMDFALLPESLGHLALCGRFGHEFVKTLQSLQTEWSLLWRVMKYLATFDEASEAFETHNYSYLLHLLNSVDGPDADRVPEVRMAERRCRDLIERMSPGALPLNHRRLLKH